MTDDSGIGYSGHSHFLPYLLNRVVLKLNIDFQLELEAFGLTFTQWRVLAFLHEKDNLSILALSEATATEPSTLSRALAKMAQRGWIARAPMVSDRRSTVVRLLPPGRRTFKQALSLAMRKMNAAIAGLSKQELQQLRHSLVRVEQNLDGLRASSTSRRS